MVDSPGVTEEEGESVARRMTEQFQCDFACGYIYVLDATQAAEEASQVFSSQRLCFLLLASHCMIGWWSSEDYYGSYTVISTGWISSVCSK